MLQKHDIYLLMANSIFGEPLPLAVAEQHYLYNLQGPRLLLSLPPQEIFCLRDR